MSVGTGIEWTEATWNPVTGCDWVSPGCDNCYARTLAKRLKACGNPRYQNDGFDRALEVETPGFGLTLHADKVSDPLRRRKATVYFVNSMSDLFHPEVPETFIRDVFATMAATPHHIYQVLTKRPRRMRDVLQRWDEFVNQPLTNVWLGTSVENQEWSERRVPLLVETPAAVRFLSCEPLLGPVELDGLLEGVQWVIVGGESGIGARPMDVDWVRRIRDACSRADVAFFFKQWGGRTPKAGGRDLDGQHWDEMPVLEPETELIALAGR